MRLHPHLSSQYDLQENHYRFLRNTGLARNVFVRPAPSLGSIVMRIVVFVLGTALVLLVTTALGRL